MHAGAHVCVSFDEYLKRIFLFFDSYFSRLLPSFLLCLAVLQSNIRNYIKGKFTEHSAQFCFLFTLAHTSNCPKKYICKMKSDWNMHAAALHTYAHAIARGASACIGDGGKCDLVANKNRFCWWDQSVQAADNHNNWICCFRCSRCSHSFDW